jgi:hypothetical protein
MKNFKILIITFLTFTILQLASCRNRYNDMLDWIDNIKPGTRLEEVKKQQPEFIEINWSRPDTIEDRVRYEIIKIDGNNDILKMQNFLTFSDDKFVGRDYQK